MYKIFFIEKVMFLQIFIPVQNEFVKILQTVLSFVVLRVQTKT